MRVRTVLGLAALVAAARAAWLHHLDNQAVIRTDLRREAFTAGQAAERARRMREEATARAWTGYSGPPLDPFVADPYAGASWPDIARVIQPLDPEHGAGWIEWGDGQHGGTSR